MRSHRAPFTVVLALALVAVVSGCGDDGGTAADGSSSTSSTTTSAATAPADESDALPAAGQAVWPPADGTTSYDDPVAAATDFATTLVGFTDPVVGAFQAGDGRSGEVPVQPSADGPVTVVLVRQLTPDDTWWVIGAQTANIRPAEPTPGAVVSSPVELAGTSTAFEGTVQVSVRSGSGDTLGSGFVTGGSMGELGPFEGSVTFDATDDAGGSVVFTNVSMEDGRVWEAAVVPVAFG